MAVPQEVQDEVNLEYQTRQDELNRALATLKQSSQTQQDTQNAYGQIGDQNLKSIYDELAKNMQGIQGQTHDLYSGSKDYLTKLFGDAQGGEQNQLASVLTSLSGSANKLGLQGGGLQEVLGKLQNTGLQGQQGLDSAKTSSLANLNQLGTGQEGVALQGVGDAYKSGANNRTELVKQVLANIAGIQGNERTGTSDLLSQLTDLSNSKATATRVAMNNYLQAQAATASGGSAGKGVNYDLDTVLKELAIQSKTDALKAFGKGSAGLSKYLAQANNGKGASNMLKDLINGVITKTSTETAASKGKGLQSATGFDAAITLLKQKPAKGHSIYGKLDPRQRAALIKALQIYYGK